MSLLGNLKGRFPGTWRTLRRNRFLRDLVYLAIEIRKSWKETETCSPRWIERDFEQHDPWSYETNEMEKRRHAEMLAALDPVPKPVRKGVEIGPAEGRFTTMLAPLCGQLLVVDIAQTPLERTRQRVAGNGQVQFAIHNLRSKDPLPGKFDLIVLAGVLEYFSRPTTFARVRGKLSEGLTPGGYVLLETTRAGERVENAWWSGLLVRGRHIHAYMAAHHSFEKVSESMTEDYIISVLRRRS